MGRPRTQIKLSLHMCCRKHLSLIWTIYELIHLHPRVSCSPIIVFNFWDPMSLISKTKICSREMQQLSIGRCRINNIFRKVKQRTKKPRMKKSIFGFNSCISCNKLSCLQKLWKSTQNIQMIKHWLITCKGFWEGQAILQQWIPLRRSINTHTDLWKFY